MSQKYKLMQDTEDITPSASIQRHLGVAAMLVLVPMIAILVLVAFTTISAARQRILYENEQHLLALTPTATPRPTRTPEPTATSIVAIRKTVKSDSELRSGPGLEHAVLSSLAGGTPITLNGRDSTGQWYRVEGGAWIAADDLLGYLPHLRVLAP